MTVKYTVPIDQLREKMDVLTLSDDLDERREEWRRYLSVRCGVEDDKSCNRIAIAMGFKELIFK